MANEKISFLLPGKDVFPCGGYKIVYEYANKFAENGYKVNIVYPHIKEDNAFFMQIKKYLGFILKKWKIQGNLKAGEWFDISPKVKKIFVFKISNFALKNKLKNNKIIATALETAFALNKLTFVPDKNKFYFIQDFESWNGNTTEDVYASYRFPFKKMAISAWLQEEVQKAGEDCVLIPNGFDFDYFKLSNSIEKRSPYEITMLYHKDDRKRCVDSINALKIVKQKIPQLHVTMFGTPDKPDLPEWFSYCQSPDKETHNEIYNAASIFVAASSKEGFGLTVGEAMICGCCVACTDNGGFAMMVSNGKTGFLSPVYDYQKLAENIIKLIENNELRIGLAKNGNEFIRQFTWERAFLLFKQNVEG